VDRDALERWTAEGLISPEQRAAIEAFEARAEPPRRISLVTEALGYLGAILIVSAFIAAFGKVLEDIGEWGRVGIFAVLTAIFLGAGALTFRSDEPAFRRLTSVLWFAAVGLAATTVGGFSIEIAELSDDVSVVIVGAAGIALSGTLWALRRAPLQLIAFTVAAHWLVISVLRLAIDEPPMGAFTVAIAAIGVAGMALGRARALDPATLAMAIGSADALVAPGISTGESDAWVWVGVAAAAGCMAFSVAVRSTPVLAIATAGMFVYVTWAVVAFLGDAVGAPLALAVSGFAILGIALGTARLRRLTKA
jgi:hypothetical protein